MSRKNRSNFANEKDFQKKNSSQGKDKKLWMRIVVLILAGVMILGAILLPLL
ncbi:hypothetical protein [Ruminococcus flavefaciens]|jgi:hypothetical protein|uniref:hypothetical protein n=1 Tax=Ruminococcus flavefaciens TaxID=1265 RepID=UPI0015677314|nr:hypothetical protein [Ruminococcus flavefaciens]MBQ6168522.1 hypothetical protein [Ruminococcus sp.]